MKRIIESVYDKQFNLECGHKLTQVTSHNIDDHIECAQCDELAFPDGLISYKKTPVFNQDTIPKGFRRAHSTKKGVWALITILNGKVRYVVDYLDGKSTDLDQYSKGIISPQMEHHLEVIDDVELYVEFYAK